MAVSSVESKEGLNDVKQFSAENLKGAFTVKSLCMVLMPYWFSTEYQWTAFKPFWFSADNTLLKPKRH